MSQSDYLKHKKIATLLKIDQVDFNPVLDSQQYIQFKQFQLNNTIISSNQQWSNIDYNTKQRIYSMDLDVSNCTPFIVCSNTDKRPHRVPMLDIYKKAFPEPLNIQQRNQAINLKANCMCD